MLRRTPLAAFAATRAVLAGNGPTFNSGGADNNTSDIANAFQMNEHGVRSSSPFPEPNTAIYDGYMSWTYFQPIDVKVELLPAPEAKYYQRLTKKPWDVSSTEWTELTLRRQFMSFWWTLFLFIMAYFMLPKEKSYSGVRGSDGFYILLPKNEPEKF